MQASLLHAWLLALGTACGAVVAADRPDMWLVGCASAGLAMVGVLARRRRSTALVAALLMGFGCGALAASLRADEGLGLQRVAKAVPYCEVGGRILEHVGELTTLAVVEWSSCEGDLAPSDGVVAVESGAPAGSTFMGSGWLVPLGPDGFDVARRRAGAHAVFTGRLETEAPDGWHALPAAVRDRFREAVATRPGPAGALLRGLTIGDTEGMSTPITEGFRRAGLSHLVAVSGSNIALVLAAMAFLVRGLAFVTRIAAAIVSLVLFVLVVGPDSSVLRAAATGGIAIVALATGRRAEPLHALALSLTAIICARPQIIFAVGLHLSAAATAGIILWTGSFERWATALPRAIRLPLVVTLAAQLAVAPIVVGVFGELSLVAPATNLAAAPAVVPATVIGFAAVGLAAIDPSLGAAVVGLAEPFAHWVLWVAEVGARPEWSSLVVPSRFGVLLAIPVLIGAGRTLRQWSRPISLGG